MQQWNARACLVLREMRALEGAAADFVIAPIVLVYRIFQRNFVTGLTQGAIK